MPGQPLSVLADPSGAAQTADPRPTDHLNLISTAVDAVSWLPGERNAWAGTWLNWPSIWDDPQPGHLAEGLGLLASGSLLPDLHARVLVKGDQDRVLPFLATWSPRDLDGANLWMRVIIARFGASAVPLAVRIAHTRPAIGADLLAPLTGQSVALLMADWLARMPGLRPAVRTWFVRHASASATALVPVALGQAGPERASAEAALRTLADWGHREAVVEAAAGYGSAATDGVNRILTASRFEVPPVWTPTLPRWLAVRQLPTVRTRDGQAIPARCVETLCGILALPHADEVRGRVSVLRRDCDQLDLVAFGNALREQWTAAGAPTRESWALTASGLLGDDDTARHLAALVLELAESGRASHADRALEALGLVESEVSLLELERLASTVPVPRVRNHARQILTRITSERDRADDRPA